MHSEGPTGLPGTVNRQELLRLSGFGILGAVLLGVTGKVLANPSPDSSLATEFEEAAEEYDVPVELLLAIGYVNTR